MANELKVAGNGVKCVNLDGDAHWKSRAEDRVRILRKSMYSCTISSEAGSRTRRGG